MKANLSQAVLPENGILLTCSSHEERCEGLVRRKGSWNPKAVIIFHYDDDNPKREERHKIMETAFSAKCTPISLLFTEADAVRSLHDNMPVLHKLIRENSRNYIVLDMSVFTKRHLLMILRWIDDSGLWDRLFIIYSEPEDYEVSEHIPLSFGISTMRQIPGYSATPDTSRTLHLTIFLGYEGDRALAVYEHIQPMLTTLVIPYPPYKAEWEGRSENFNRDLIMLVGNNALAKVDAIDPEVVKEALVQRLGDVNLRSQHGKVVCPLGTKPQTLGLYMYARDCYDPPAIVYASTLRHNHNFYSYGIGKTWLLKTP